MRPGVSALVAICAVLAAPLSGRADIPAPASAQPPAQPAQPGLPAPAEPVRRQVAVIDLSEDEAVRTLSTGIYKALNQSDVLRNPDQRLYDQYLTGPLFDEDSGHVDAAKRLQTAAETDLFTGFDSRKAVADAEAGEHELLWVVPAPDARALYAALALVRGLALLDQKDAVGAARAFALSHRLDPATQLDPARYPPDITDAFKKAIATPGGAAAIAVHGGGHVWIDGVERGDASDAAVFDVDAGDHYVVLTGAARETSGIALRVDPKARAEVAIPDAPAPPELLVKRTRLALSRAQAKNDDAARAGAMQQLATLLGVGDAVMISKRADGKLQWETWKDRAPGFSRPKVYVDQKPDDLLVGLAPPPKPRDTEPAPVVVTFVRPPVIADREWYQLRWVQASAAAGLAVAIVGAIFWARRDQTVNVGRIIGGM